MFNHIEDGSGPSLFEPESVLPTQFFHFSWVLLPGHKLVLAVLEDAIKTLKDMSGIRGIRGDRIWNETVSWVLAEEQKQEKCFTFVFCCDQLRLNPDSVRRALDKLYGLVLREESPRAHRYKHHFMFYRDVRCINMELRGMQVVFPDRSLLLVPRSVLGEGNEVWEVGDVGKLVLDARWKRRIVKAEKGEVA